MKTTHFAKSIIFSLLLVQIFISSTNSKEYKQIEKVFTPEVGSEGAGAKIRRIIGTHHNRKLDPFLMLDHFTVRLPGGFPDHPHRGFDTVTYMLGGTVYHEDFKGNKGAIRGGDLQWMTAGRGIVHSEMPASWDEDSNGFQLWLNLAASDKFCEPEYQEIKKDKIPVVSQDNVVVKVIAGESLGVKGPIVARTPTLYIDVELKENSVFEQVIPKGWNAVSYVYEGEALYGPLELNVRQNSVALVKNDDNEVLIIKTKERGAKLILVAGQPMNEEVVSHGPFVLSNHQDLQKTFSDFRLGQNGFENAPTWRSKIQHLASDKKIAYDMEL